MSKSYYKSFITDNLIAISGVALVYLKGIIMMPIIIKSVGVTTYGGFVLLTSILGIAFALSSFGAGFRARRFMPSAKAMTERGELFYPQFYFNILNILILSLLFVLFEKQLNTHLFKNEVSFSIWIVPLYLVLYLLYSQGSDYFRYTSRIYYMTLLTLCFPYLHIGLILLYFHSYGTISINMLVISMALSALLTAIPSFFVIFREIGTKLVLYKTESLISDIKMGFPLVLGFFIDLILAGGDRYFIALFLSVTDVGYYVPGYVLGSLIVFIPKALGTALPQLLSRAVDNGNISESQIMLDYAIKLFLLLAIPFTFGCLSLSKPLLTLLANQEVAEKAFWVAPIVALGTVFYGMTIILSSVMFAHLKTTQMFKMNLIAALFSLLANVVLIYFFRNIIMAAITALLSYFIAFLYSYNIVTKECFVSFYPTTIAKTLAASIIMFGMISLISLYLEISTPVLQIILIMAIGITVYIGLLLSFKAFTKKEIGYLKTVLSKCK
jgi:O-antigen/teichoic acid export membrane protein